MKIKLAILENDLFYVKKIMNVFNTRYSDKIQIYSFSEPKKIYNFLETEKIDVLAADDAFEVDFDRIPKRCGFAYLVDSADVESFNGKSAICKFQKAELIYKQILSIYSEQAGSFEKKWSDNDCKIITFTSPAGGTGTSTLAAACAVCYASKGKKVLYLNFDNYASTDIFFSGEGYFDMSDVIFEIKSKKANLALKLESYVKQDHSGVCFFSQAKNALDMIELKNAERMLLLEELSSMGFDCIVVDSPFSLDADHLDLFVRSHEVIMVSNGTEIANFKIINAYNAVRIMDQNADMPIANRFCLAYNNFHASGCSKIDDSNIKNIGGVPVFANASPSQIVFQIAKRDLFEKID